MVVSYDSKLLGTVLGTVISSPYLFNMLGREEKRRLFFFMDKGLGRIRANKGE
jgi:hypothetical protein